MNDYKSLRKKNSSRVLALVIALLVVLEMCSLAVLFNQIAPYSVSSNKYVISLTEGADRTKAGTVDTSKTGFIVPTSVVDPDTLIEPEDSVNTYDFGFSTYDLDQVWTTDTDVALFHLQYDNENGVTTVLSENEDKVFAPGTANTYSFTVANTGSHSLDYLVYLEVTEDCGEYQLPLVGRLRRGDGTYLVGSDTESSSWPDVLELHESGDLSSLAPGASMEYSVDWEWPFERFGGEGLEANDAYDTFLGNLAVDTDLWLNIKIKTVAWWEDYWYATADVKEGEGTASVTPDKVDQATDDTFTFTAEPAEGYEFAGWEFDNGDIFEIIDGSLTDPMIVVRPGSDVHGHAIFVPIPTEPTEPIPTEPTEPIPTEPTEPIPTEPTEPIPTEPTEPIPTEPTEPIPTEPTEPIPTEPTEPTEPIEEYYHAYIVEIIGDGTAEVDPDTVKKDSGEPFVIHADPGDGYEFDHWEFDEGDIYEIISGSLTDPDISLIPGSDIHIHAVFKTKATEPTIVTPTVKPTEKPDQPSTGDNTNALLWLIISLIIFAALVVAFIIYYRIRKAEKVGQRFDD